MKKNMIIKLIQKILLGFSTLLMLELLVESIELCYYACFDKTITYVKGEEFVYLFLAIACVFQLVLMYMLAFFHKIKIKNLKNINIIIFILGTLFLMASVILDYKLYDMLYNGDISFFVFIAVIYYVALLPSIFIFRSERRKIIGD